MDTDLHEILICFVKVERVRTEKEDLIDKSRVPINKNLFVSSTFLQLPLIFSCLFV